MICLSSKASITSTQLIRGAIVHLKLLLTSRFFEKNVRAIEMLKFSEDWKSAIDAADVKKFEKILIQNNGRIDEFDPSGKFNPLLYAILKNRIECVFILYKMGADFLCENSLGFSALEYAVHKRRNDIALYMATHNDYYHVPFSIWAGIELNEKRLVFLGLEKGGGNYISSAINDFFINATVPYTPLFHAIDKENIEMVKLLLDAGVDPNLTLEWHDAPIHLAVKRKKMDIVRALLEKGVDPNALGEDGATPLYYAKMIGKKCREISDLLASLGGVESVMLN